MSRMSSVNLTPEQARALLPLLQSIAFQPQQTWNDSSPESSLNSSFAVHCGSSPEEPDEEIGYSLKELLVDKKKNSKSTEAQNFLHVSVQVAIRC